jgi:hypothetical protein
MRRLGRSWSITLVVLGLLLPAPAAHAKKFKGSELLIGHSVKPPKGAKRFLAGIDFQFAPFSVLLASQKDVILGQAVSSACAGLDDPSLCANNTGVAMDALAEIDGEDWDLVNSNLTDTAVLQENLGTAGIAGADSDAVVQYVERVPVEDRRNAVGLARELTSHEATTLLIEPRAEVNLRHIYIGTSLPMAIYMFPNSSKFASGNLGIDLRYGLFWKLSKIGLALSFGLDTWLPAGMADADAMALGNLLYGPKFYHRFMTTAPYIVAGLDATFMTVQISTEIVPMFPVRDAKGWESVVYGRYGLGLTFFPKYIFSLVGELNGLYPIANADLYTSLFASGGFRVRIWRFRGSIAAQFPLLGPTKSELGKMGGVDLGTLADFTLLTRLSFTF